MTPGNRWMQRVAAIGCVICLQLGLGTTPAEVHHVAEGSGLRSDFSVAPLCPEHHRGSAGLHGMGVKAFCALYRIPGESEYGLLVLVNERLARA
jgi:hypothetical protein